MKIISIAAVALLSTAGIALAQAPTDVGGDLAKKQMQDNPGTTGGATDMPTAKPSSSAPGDKQATEMPKGGTTADPTAKPATSDPAAKQMQDNPGTK